MKIDEVNPRNQSSSSRSYLVVGSNSRVQISDLKQIFNIISNGSEIWLRIQEKKLSKVIYQLLTQLEQKPQICIVNQWVVKIHMELMNRLSTIQNSQKKFMYFQYIMTKYHKSYDIEYQTLNDQNINLLIPQLQINPFKLYFNYIMVSKNNLNFHQQIASIEDLQLSSPYCPSCVQKFTLDSLISLGQFGTKNVIFIDKKQSNNLKDISEWICSLLNSHGGTIFIGINPKQLKVEGDYHSFQSFEQYYNLIKDIKILPDEFDLKIEAIPVCDETIPTKNGKMIQGLIVTRIMVKPESPQKLYYLLKQYKGFKSQYHSFILDQNQEKFSLKGLQYYKFLHMKYQKPKPFKSLHWNSACLPPHQCDYLPQEFKKNQQKQEMTDVEFSLKYQSLVKISKNKASIFDKFEKELEIHKYAYKKQKVFQSLEEGGGWKFWLLCHQETITNMINFLTKKEKEILKIYEINHKIFIKTPIMVSMFSELEENFCKLFNRPKLMKEYQEKKEKKFFDVKFKLNNKLQAIYVFMFAEIAALRPEYTVE